MRIPDQRKPDDSERAETKSKNAMKRAKKKAKAKAEAALDLSPKIKQLPKEVKEFTRYIGLDEEKGINTPQLLGSKLKKMMDTRLYLLFGGVRASHLIDPLAYDPERIRFTPLTQIIELYKQFLDGKLKPEAKSALPKFLNRKYFMEAVRLLLQFGADPELSYIDAPYCPAQNPLIRAEQLRNEEKEVDRIPTLFSTILNHSSFDVNKSFYDYEGYNNYITPLSYMLGTNINCDFEYREPDLQELLLHPDLEINTGQDLLFTALSDKKSKIVRDLLDFGFNPNQTQIIDPKKSEISEGSTISPICIRP